MGSQLVSTQSIHRCEKAWKRWTKKGVGKEDGEESLVTSPKTNIHIPWKMLAGRQFSFWNGPFSGDIRSFSGGVP